MAEKLTKLFQCMLRKEAIPQNFKDASIINLYKRKGNPQPGDNHRKISLLSIAGKILAKILLNRLNAHLDQSGLKPENVSVGSGKKRDNRHDLYSLTTSREMSRAKC